MNNDRFYLRDEHGVTEEYMIVGGIEDENN